MRGEGTIRQRGAVFWIRYYHRGQRFEESGGRTGADARRLLKQRLREIHGDRFVGPKEERLTVNELLDSVISHLEMRGAKSVVCSGKRKTSPFRSQIRPIRDFFGSEKAIDLTTSLIERYQKERLAAGKQPSTVNRELGALRLALNHARKQERLKRVPYFPMFGESNARQGFLARETFLEILRRISDASTCDFLEWFFWTGMRPGEIASLAWTGFDRETSAVRLHPRNAKTGHGRLLSLTPELRRIIDRRFADRRLGCDLIFHRDGLPISTDSVLNRWERARLAAGLPHSVPYDLRRTAVRNMTRAGVPDRVAMEISGHRTRAVFDRYNITSEEDIRDAMVRTAAYVDGLPSNPRTQPQAASSVISLPRE